jgi:hypothetical protein
MAGYGNILKHCAKMGCSSYSIEANPPSYLWTVLFNPADAAIVTSSIALMIHYRSKWPRTREHFTLSNDWFHENSIEMLSKLFNLLNKTTGQYCKPSKAKELALAILLPFSGRLSNTAPGNIVTHVKPGGICVYDNWQDDFVTYLSVLSVKIQENADRSIFRKHKVVLADCRTADMPANYFPAMITSPPYPNSRDYTNMFAPENYLLRIFDNKGVVSGYSPNSKLIGSVIVSDIKSNGNQNIENIKSKAACSFLYKIMDYKATKKAIYDNKVYYLPYFINYFKSLEDAYHKISNSLHNDFEGYIIVVNNTARGIAVPVAEFVVDIWSSLGYDVQIDYKLSKERSHFGAINPRAKGLRAKHMEYVMQIKR